MARANGKGMTLVLEGIRVLELTDAISGPYAGMLLAGCGAEVIRVESLRHLGFRGMTGAMGSQGVFQMTEDKTDFSKVDVSQFASSVFARYNLDKKSVVMNLNNLEGRELFERLVGVSDVVIDNLGFGVTQQWGFDYQALKRMKEDIVLVSMPSLGKGPYEQWTTWGMNLLSFTGFAYSWGHPDTPVEERAASNTYGDYIAAMKAAAAAVAALYHRAKTGQGEHVEISQAESTASLLGVSYLDYFVNNRTAQPHGNRHNEFAPYNCYRCKGDDRWCVIAVSSEEEWQQLRRALQSPKWTEDPRFQTAEGRLANVDELDNNVEAWTRQRTPHQVMRMLQAWGVPAGAVQNSEDLFFDLQLRSRNHMVQLGLGPYAGITFDGPPIRLATGQKPYTERSPMLGEHNDYVYRDLLGLTTTEVEELIERRAIF